MKKAITIVYLLLLALFVVGCDTSENTDTNEPPIAENKPVVKSKPTEKDLGLETSMIGTTLRISFFPKVAIKTVTLRIVIGNNMHTMTKSYTNLSINHRITYIESVPYTAAHFSTYYIVTILSGEIA